MVVYNYVLESMMDFMVELEIDRFPLGESVFSRKYDLFAVRIERKCDELVADVWAACRIGLLTEAVANATVNELRDMVRKTHANHRNAYEKRIGTEVYEREWCEYHHYDYDYYKTL